MILSRREYRVQVDTVESQLLNIIQILPDPLYGSAQTAFQPDAVLPFHLFSLSYDLAVSAGKAVRENIINDCLPEPLRFLTDLFSADKRILVKFASLYRKIFCADICIIKPRLFRVFQFKIVAYPVIRSLKSCIIIVKMHIRQYLLHVHCRKHNRITGLYAVSVPQNTICQIILRHPDTNCKIPLTVRKCILRQRYM